MILKDICHLQRTGRILVLYQFYSWFALSRLRCGGVKAGRDLKVYGWLDLNIHRTSTMSIGRNVRINSSFALNAVGGSRRTGFWVGCNGTLVIGSNVGISNSTLVCTDSITIGDDVFIGGGCNIYDTDFHPIESHERIARSPETTKIAPISIGSKAFIGAHSIVLKGVTIGEGAVIGAGSVVTRDIPEYEIWAGNPVRMIRPISRPSSG